MCRNTMNSFFISLLYFFATVLKAGTIRVELITMPTPAFKGQDVELFCAFNMENKKLYALKWFKNDVEFYRYLPRETPAVKIYDASGVFVNKTNSHGGKVHLTQVTLSTAGDYKCLVSEEKPSFRTKFMVRKLIVYDLPKKPPEIFTPKNRFKLGDKISFNCTSQPSFPVTDLKWFINNKAISESSATTYPVKKLLDGRFLMKKELSFMIKKKNINTNGEMTVECQSSVQQYYNKSDIHIIKVDHVKSRSSTKKDIKVDIQELADKSAAKPSPANTVNISNSCSDVCNMTRSLLMISTLVSLIARIIQT